MRQRDHGPHGRVGVLAAVLADAARIGLDVARLLQRFLEWRREQQRERRIAPQQVRLQRLHGARGARRIGRARDHAPGLRDGVDAALVVAAPSPAACHRRRSRGDTTRHPSHAARARRAAAPPAPASRSASASSPRSRASGANAVSVACRNQPSQTLSPRPCSPTRFMPSFQSPVPISGRPCGPSCTPSRPRRQCSNSVAVCARRCGSKNASCRSGGSGGPSMNGQLLVEDGAVAGELHVVRGDVRQPHAIVGDVRAHALAAVRQPPVLHVALGELAARGAQDLLAQQLRPRERPAPSRPAADRGSRRRRWPGRTRRAPRCGRRASGTAASRSS